MPGPDSRMPVFTPAAVRAWPLEIKLTVVVWLVCFIYSLGLGLWLAIMGTGGLSDIVLAPFGIWWVFNVFVYLQFWCYRALGTGCWAMWVRMAVEPEFRYSAKRRLEEARTGRRPRS